MNKTWNVSSEVVAVIVTTSHGNQGRWLPWQINMRQQQSKLSVILFQLSTMNYDQIVSDFYRHLTLDIGLYLRK